MRGFSSLLRPAGALLLALLLLWLTAQAGVAQATPLPPVNTPTAVLVTVAPIGTPTPRPGSYAGLVVRFGDGSVVTRCVHFDEAEISGDELLIMSGLNPAIDEAGAVCALGGQGCPVDDCFCACPFPDCQYWAYYYQVGGAWAYSEVGPYMRSLRQGDVDGWVWGDGGLNSAPPPSIEFHEICPNIQATATPTPQQPFPIPTRTSTATPTPSPTPAPAPPAEIPEPATLLLAASGLAGLGAWVGGLRRSRN